MVRSETGRLVPAIPVPGNRGGSVDLSSDGPAKTRVDRLNRMIFYDLEDSICSIDAFPPDYRADFSGVAEAGIGPFAANVCPQVGHNRARAFRCKISSGGTGNHFMHFSQYIALTRVFFPVLGCAAGTTVPWGA
jgi:hypothetical protein